MAAESLLHINMLMLVIKYYAYSFKIPNYPEMVLLIPTRLPVINKIPTKHFAILGI